MSAWSDLLLRECAACHYIHDCWPPGEEPPAVRRACYTALSPDFGARVGFCAEHLGWMADYPGYYDTITKLCYQEWL